MMTEKFNINTILQSIITDKPTVQNFKAIVVMLLLKKFHLTLT